MEGLGHEVIVAGPNFAPMYATRTRKVKTDRRDARALAEACLLGGWPVPSGMAPPPLDSPHAPASRASPSPERE